MKQLMGICRECMQLIKELQSPVVCIVLPTHAYEHKILIAPMQCRFPRAKVYVAEKWVKP
jgi:hypothetical protein